MTCSNRVYPESISDLETTNAKLAEYWTIKLERVFLSNHDIVIMSSKGNFSQEDEIWELLCKLNDETPGCNIAGNNTYRKYISCPKYALKPLPAFWTKSIALTNCEKVLAEEMMKHCRWSRIDLCWGIWRYRQRLFTKQNNHRVVDSLLWIASVFVDDFRDLLKIPVIAHVIIQDIYWYTHHKL